VRAAPAALAALLCLAGGCGDGSPQASAPRTTIDPRKADAAAQAVESYLTGQRIAEAVTVAERFAAEAPALMRSQELLGRALVAQAMDEATPAAQRDAIMRRAADAYDAATRIDPRNAPLAHAAGVVCDTAGLHDRAADHYAAAHDRDPRHAQYALYLALARARQGRTDEARKLAEAAEAAMPESPDPKAALADLAVRSDDLDRALAKVREARALDPSSNGLRLAEARILRMAGRPEEALALLVPLDPPVRRAPGYADELAAAYAATGRLREAAQAMEESAVMRPADAMRALRTARAWRDSGDPIKSSIWVETAMLAGAPAEEVAKALGTP
jgi:tetratricopeptide (TPR) repeat protein